LAGRDLHPLDDEPKFQGDIARPPIPIDQQGLVALNFLSPAHCSIEAVRVRFRLSAGDGEEKDEHRAPG